MSGPVPDAGKRRDAFETSLTETNVALSDLVEAVESKSAAFETTLTEISTALSDLVEAVESRADGDAIGKAIAAALKGVRIAAPDVTVSAAPATVHFNERAPAKGWHIKFEYGFGTSVPTGAKMTRID